MLASITPLGERGRHSRWSVTVAAYALAATAAGALLGLVLGGVGDLGALALGGSDRVAAGPRLWALAVAAVIALGLDARAARGRGRVPGPRRQVAQRWLTAYRGWVYGAGLGAQLGVGVATVVTSAATWLALAAAVLSGVPARGAVILGAAGLVRGATPLLTAGANRPDRLVTLHRRLAARRVPVERATLAGLAVIAAVALALALSGASA